MIIDGLLLLCVASYLFGNHSILSVTITVVEASDDTEESDGGALNPAEAILANNRMVVRAAVSLSLELPPTQQGRVILKDVLDYSHDEIAAMLDLNVFAVKTALHRGRARLRKLSTGVISKRTSCIAAVLCRAIQDTRLGRPARPAR